MAIRRTASRFRFGGRRRDRGTARSPAHEHTRQQKKKKKLKGTKPKSKLTYASRAPPRASLAAIPALAPPRLPRRRRRRIRRLGFRPLANDAKLSSGEGKRKEKKKKGREAFVFVGYSCALAGLAPPYRMRICYSCGSWIVTMLRPFPCLTETGRLICSSSEILPLV